jgi:DNA repair exonuclease SbcCD ATPase subunit
MVEFKELHIENYLSITDLNITFTNGVVSLTGVNGSGKTSTLTALQMCLFNKNMRNPKGNIEDNYNKYTGSPYKISCVFEKDGVLFSITNDRNTNQITILQDGKDVSPKGIKQQLAKIESILGVDFATFSSLTFISQSTLTAIFDLTSSENMLYRFLDIDLLNHIEKQLKAKQSDLKKYSSSLLSGVNALNSQEEALKSFEKIDIDGLRRKQNLLQESLLLLNDSEDNHKVKILRDTEGKLKQKFTTIREKYVATKTRADILQEQIAGLEDGVCPTCKQSVTVVTQSVIDELKVVKDSLKVAAAEGRAVESELEKITTKIKEISSELQTKKQDILNDLNEIKGRILVVEDQQKNYDNIKASLEGIIKQKQELMKEYADLNHSINFCGSALGVIKSGAVTKEYVQNFVRLLNSNISDIVSTLGFKIVITAIDKRGSVDFEFVHKEVHKTYNDLSSGEKTKCSLICLFAVLDALEFLTGTSFNVLCLDEILSVVDKEGLELFKTLLNKYRENKTVFLVSHHNEIDTKFFDSHWNAKIINNNTTLEIF